MQLKGHRIGWAAKTMETAAEHIDELKKMLCDQETPENLIRKTPGVVGGEARIRDTRIPAWTVVQLMRRGMPDDEIVGYFGVPLTEADLEAVVTYYAQNKAEIDQAIQENEAA